MITEVTVKKEVDKTALDRRDGKLCFNCEKHWPHQVGLMSEFRKPV